MATSMSDLNARMNLRKQRLEEEQQEMERKRNLYAKNPEGISETSELESSRQAPKPKQRHRRSSNKSPFDDDSSVQFGYHDKKSASTTTTSSSTPRQPNKFVKKSSTIPVTTEKISVTHSPRDVSSPRMSRTRTSEKNPQPSLSTGLLTQSSLLARAAHRQQLHAKGIELEPGTFDKPNDDDESSSEATSTSGAKILHRSGKKNFLKKSATNTPVANQVPDLQHLDSETNDSERDGKKNKHRPSSVLDTEDDSSLDFIGDGSSSEGRKTPTLTPRKGILKSPKDFNPKEIEHSVQFSKDLVVVQTDDEERTPTPIKSSRLTTPRRVQIAAKPSKIEDDTIHSETESISTAIDVVDDDDYGDIPFSEHISESPVDNMFANIIMNDEQLVKPVVKKKSPRVPKRKSPRVPNRKSPSPRTKSDHKNRTISEITEDDNTRVEEIPEELSVVHYSEDFSVATTESSTPRTVQPATIRIEKPPSTIRKVSTDDQQVQVDLMSAPFQSSLNQVHSIYLINQSDFNENRPSSLIRSVVDPNVLQSLLTTNPVLLAVDDLIREQSSLLRSFIHLQRTYYESTVRSIQPEHVYVTKDNTLQNNEKLVTCIYFQFIADQQQSRMHFQSNDDSITN
ncbi:unnamed protein product [Rotaria socialis]|uniref:DUF4614 domain-containing protein n=1 Tax=Rotaria socialis TaxID=392032 RepID=A0A818TUL6_9BILA|nr:unnamed protein product [Rotaria socialis]CAF4532603.1 unnamed protein product [Rotaria socialis]